MKDKKQCKVDCLAGDTLTYEGIQITAIKGETVQQFADRINKTIGKTIAIVTGNPEQLVKE